MSGIIGRASGHGSGIVGAEGRIGQTCTLSWSSSLSNSSGLQHLTGYTTIIYTAPEMYTPVSTGITVKYAAVYFVKISIYISVKTGSASNYTQNGLAHSGNTRDDRVYCIFSADGSYGGHRQTIFASNVIDLVAGRTYGLWNSIQDGNRNINGATDNCMTGITLTYMSEA